jgi:hypothetical protein
MSKSSKFTVSSHFEGKAPVVREIYDELIGWLKSAYELGE